MKTKEEVWISVIERLGFSQRKFSEMSNSDLSICVSTAMDEYASQFQPEWPNVKVIVKKFIDSDEPDTFIRNEHGVLMYYSHDKKSGINLESYFEDIVQYVYDEISANSPQPYNPTKS